MIRCYTLTEYGNDLAKKMVIFSGIGMTEAEVNQAMLLCQLKIQAQKGIVYYECEELNAIPAWVILQFEEQGLIQRDIIAEAEHTREEYQDKENAWEIYKEDNNTGR